MFDMMTAVDHIFEERCRETSFFWLLGKAIESVEEEVMVRIWTIPGQCMSKTYKKVVVCLFDVIVHYTIHTYT